MGCLPAWLPQQAGQAQRPADGGGEPEEELAGRVDLTVVAAGKQQQAAGTDVQQQQYVERTRVINMDRHMVTLCRQLDLRQEAAVLTAGPTTAAGKTVVSARAAAASPHSAAAQPATITVSTGGQSQHSGGQGTVILPHTTI